MTRAGDPRPACPLVHLAAILLAVLPGFLLPSPAFPQDAGPLHLRADARPIHPLPFAPEDSPARPEGMAIDLPTATTERSGIPMSWIVVANAAGILLVLLGVGGWHRGVLLRMNRALDESRSRFGSLVETTGDIVWEIDADAVLTYVSPGVREILGYEPGELIGKSAFDFLAPEGISCDRRTLEEAIDGRKLFTAAENVYLHKTGRRVLLEGNGVPFFGPDGAHLGFRGIHRDVTARKRLEEELRSSEAERISARKYEAVGKLAVGIARNIYNLMTIVGGSGSLLLKKLDPLDPRRKEIREILYAGDRAAMLTGQLLAFGRRPVLMTKVEAIDALVEGLIPSLRSLMGDEIEIAVHRESPGVTVRVDARQFATAIEELARNAKDAMPGGGRLDVTTGTRTVEGPSESGPCSAAPGRYATVSVADTGCGMDQEALSSLFEPSEPTKGTGRGMGLPSVYGFVKQSSGFVDVESSPGNGTSITIGLPLSRETASA